MAAQSSKQSLLFNPAAFAFVMVDLPAKLAGATAARKNDKATGISLRFVEQYSITTDQNPVTDRFDRGSRGSPSIFRREALELDT